MTMAMVKKDYLGLMKCWKCKGCTSPCSPQALRLQVMRREGQGGPFYTPRGSAIPSGLPSFNFAQISALPCFFWLSHTFPHLFLSARAQFMSNLAYFCWNCLILADWALNLHPYPLLYLSSHNLTLSVHRIWPGLNLLGRSNLNGLIYNQLT